MRDAEKKDIGRGGCAAARGMDRRNFLKGAGLAGLGALSLGTLGACASTGQASGESTSASEVKWDKEVDVLVVGSGTGAYAAVFAKDNGAENVCIVEKDKRFGGTASTSGGVIWTPMYFAGENPEKDSREDALTYMKLVADGRGNEAAMEAYVDNANAMVEYMRDKHGWEWVPDQAPVGFKDYYDPLEGFRSFGRQAALEGAGPGMWAALETIINESGIEFMSSTAATELIVDDAGKVVGVVAGGKNIKANTCVVLSTGGFDFNPEMVRSYQSIPIYATVTSPTCTGDGHLMGAAIGAALGNMDTNWGLPTFLAEPFDPHADVIYDMANTDWGVARAGAGSIIVNKKGKRFANESTAYARFNRAFGAYSTEDAGWANIPAVWICDSKYVEAGGGLLPGQFASDPGDAGNEGALATEIPANMFKADSLAEIADHFGIDAAGLEAEVAKFNEYAASGIDMDFHRGEEASDLAIGALHPYIEGEDLANPVLAPLATPPFYASLYAPGACGTNGGLVINEYAQVLDTKGEVIEGLLAVGNCTASINGGQYTGGGATLGAGAVMSFVGMNHLLG